MLKKSLELLNDSNDLTGKITTDRAKEITKESNDVIDIVEDLLKTTEDIPNTNQQNQVSDQDTFVNFMGIITNIKENFNTNKLSNAIEKLRNALVKVKMTARNTTNLAIEQRMNAIKKLDIIQKEKELKELQNQEAEIRRAKLEKTIKDQEANLIATKKLLENNRNSAAYFYDLIQKEHSQDEAYNDRLKNCNSFNTKCKNDSRMC